MTAQAPKLIHAAIFATADPAARCELTVKGTLDSVLANVPAGGTWRPGPPTALRHADIPPLGQLPAAS
jgi:hypothetical protein